MKQKLKGFFQGDQRTVKARKNVLASAVLKGIDSLVYLLLVPVTLGYLNPYEYGIWLTLNSILMWINSFDIGLGNGMRNKLAIAEAAGDKTLSRIYVSTTFFMLMIVMAGLVLLGSLAEPFVDWYTVLSASPESVPHLDEIVYVAFSIFCLNFIFRFIGNVYLAMQLPAVNNFFVTAGHLLALIIIFVLTRTTHGSLMAVAVVYSASPLVVYLLAYPVTFRRIYPYLAPSVKFFKAEYLKDLFSIGVQFFLLQLSAIVLFAFANILISHLFGPENVTPYNISYRYFSVLPMVMNIIIAPMWSATTDAYARGDLEWIRSTMSRIHRYIAFALMCIVVMIAISEPVYRIWVGTEVKIPFVISMWMGVYTAILVVSLSYSNFLNGLGKLRIQTINTVTVALLFYPLCWFLGRHWGIPGVLVGMCLLNTSGLLLNIIQFHKVVSGRAKGIWNR